MKRHVRKKLDHALKQGLFDPGGEWYRLDADDVADELAARTEDAEREDLAPLVEEWMEEKL